MDLGYSGLFVTDHFFNGNTAIPHNLPWKEWVKQFCRGYEEAKNEGDKLGFDVFFGWEETFTGGDDYLVFGLDKEWLLEHPEMRTWTRGEQYSAVKSSGGCVVQAHPFRQHYYINKIVLSSGCVDAVEVANSGNNEKSYDALAMRYATKLGLPIIAGSDMHDSRLVDKDWVFGTYFKNKLTCAKDIVDSICNDQLDGILVSEGRCDLTGDEKVKLPVEVRDKHDKKIQKGWRDLI
jgi:predicted metal-dependent phosphoesterase TrpH